MNIVVLCDTVGSGTDEDPFRPYVSDLWTAMSAIDRREEGLLWIVELLRPDSISKEAYEESMRLILEDPSVTLFKEVE